MIQSAQLFGHYLSCYSSRWMERNTTDTFLFPDVGEEDPQHIESYELTEEDEDLLDADFIDPIDRLRDSLIDLRDVDCLNAGQCRLMLGWLEQRLNEPIDPRLETIHRKLVEFANRAIELDTGIVFDL